MAALLDGVSPNTVGLILLAAIVALWLALRLPWPGRPSDVTKCSRSHESTASAQALPSAAPASLGEPPLKGWWTDASHFQLERRAIFSKTWICVSHRGRFAKPGDYVAQDLAGFRIVLILGKDGVVRAFHNVCRHRAFPVARKAAGTAAILACQYHGWTYNALGQLTTAPHFDQLPGFSRSENGLFAIRTRTDSRGFLHVNLNGEAAGGVVDEVDEAEMMEYPQWTGRPAHIDKGSALLVHSWTAKGQFNWKTASGSEMRGASAFSGVPTSGGFLAQKAHAALAACGLAPDPTGRLRFFPLATVHTREGSPFWCHIVCSPDSPQQTTLRCDVYATSQAGSSWRCFDDGAKGRLEARLRRLIEAYERAYAQLSDPVLGADSGDINNYDHSRIAGLVQAHRTLERVAGREIHPAAVQQCRSPAFAQAESICRAMTNANSKLEW